jgi:DNA-binding transcriptional LysR family regulator
MVGSEADPGVDHRDAGPPGGIHDGARAVHDSRRLDHGMERRPEATIGVDDVIEPVEGEHGSRGTVELHQVPQAASALPAADTSGGDIDVPGLLARFSRAHPGVEVGLREGIADDMFRRLATDELDAAFCLLAGEPPDERLSDEEVVTGFASDRDPSAPHVTVADLARHTIVAPRRGSAITSVLEQLFADAGQPLRLALESGDPFLLRSLAARGFATAILPRSITSLEGPALEVRSLDPAVRVPVALVWRNGRNAPPPARTFIDFGRGEATTLSFP